MRILKVCIFAIVFISCIKSNQRKEPSYENTLGHFELPTSYYLFKHKNIDSLEFELGDINVFTRINASCATCLTKFKQLNDLYQHIQKIRPVSFYVVCHSEDNFELLKFLFESERLTSTDYTLILDQGDINDRAKNILELNETIVTDNDLNILFQQDVINDERAIKNLLETLKSS